MKKLLSFLAGMIALVSMCAAASYPQSEHIGFPIQVARDLHTGCERFTIFGDNPAITTSYETLRHVGGTYDWEKANGVGTGTTVYVSSTSASDITTGTGARTLTIKGLTATYAETNETISMNGTNAVSGSVVFYRINEVIVATVGSGYVNAGDIYIAETNGVSIPSGGIPDTTNGLFGIIATGEGRTHGGVYTVPLGKSALRLSETQSMGGGSTLYGIASSRQRPYGGSWRTEASVNLSSIGGPSHAACPVPCRFTAKTDIELRAKTYSGTSAFAGQMELLIMDDTVGR